MLSIGGASPAVCRSLAAVVLFAVGTAGCAAPPRSYTVTIDGLRYQPESLTVTVGDSVVWVNQDPFPHTATSAGAFDSHTIDVGKSWTYKTTTAGTFAYACTFHPTMKGTLVVK